MNDHNQDAEGEFGHVDKIASLLGGLHIFHHCLGFLDSSYGSLMEGRHLLGAIRIAIVVFRGFAKGRFSPMQKIVDNYQPSCLHSVSFFVAGI